MAIDFYSEIGKVRLLTGDFQEPVYLIDDILAMKLQEYNSESNPKVKIWKVALDCLQIMIAEAGANASRVREREGGVEIEEYRFERYKALKDRYKDLLDDPPDGAFTDATTIVIGGVSITESNRVRSNADSKRPSIGIGWFDSEDF